MARYGVISWLGASDPTAFPWDTLAVNLAGSLLIGLFFRAWRSGAGGWRTDRARLFFTTGVLGGFTTFSTLSLDTVDLFRHDAWSRGVAYLAVSLIGGLLLAAIGYGRRRSG
jgi:CrcB protein